MMTAMQGLAPVRALQRLLPIGRLPNAVIIGAQKAGTTSLFHYLSQHSEVTVSFRKEVHFFDNNFAKGVGWYRSQFPLFCSTRILLEATPYYLFHSHVPKRALEVIPTAKFIVLVREPISRTYSHFQHAVSRGQESLPFHDAILAEERRLLVTESVSSQQSFSRQRYSYVARSKYAEQLSRWFEFFPREQFLILKSEDMYDDPQSVCDRVYKFLSIGRESLGDSSPRYQREYAPLPPEQQETLRKVFRRSNERLFEMTGIAWG